MRGKANNEKKAMIRIIKTPIRALCKAKDLYIKGIISFTTTYNRPMMIMETSPCAQPLPRSFSVADSDLYKQNQQKDTSMRISSRVPRSCSVGMGTIDEDRVSSFRIDNILRDRNSLFSGSRSTYAQRRF